jgi:hypothetical protein
VGDPGLFREMMRKFGIDAQPRVEVQYEDMDGNGYSQKFVLAIDPSDRIIWDPESLECVKPASEAL